MIPPPPQAAHRARHVAEGRAHRGGARTACAGLKDRKDMKEEQTSNMKDIKQTVHRFGTKEDGGVSWGGEVRIEAGRE